MENETKTPRDIGSRGVFYPWRDPVCLGSWALYLLNRFFLIRHFGGQFPFLREHGDDSLFVPAALPLFLWARQTLRLRRDADAPTWREIVFWTALASVLFEWLGPKFLGHNVGDWGDVAAYWAGALVAGAWWNRKGLEAQEAQKGQLVESNIE